MVSETSAWFEPEASETSDTSDSDWSASWTSTADIFFTPSRIKCDKMSFLLKIR